MMNMKKTLLLITLLLLLAGIVSATDTSNSSQKIQDDVTDHITTQVAKEVKSTSNKLATKTTVTNTNGTIGEQLNLTAKITSNDNKKVNDGYVIYKLNGITLKDNNKLTGTSNPLKVNVKDGIASVNVTADINMRHAQNITAIYSGSTIHDASRSNMAKVNILLRNATITVSGDKKILKQGEKLTIKANVYDVSNNKKTSSLIPYDDEYVYFKVNGLTFKDENGDMLKVPVINGVATANYTIPLALSGVTDAKTMTVKNHTIFAGYANKNYYPTAQDTSYFQVERSPITIRFNNVNIDNRQHTLSLNATLKDYLGNNVYGPNKCIVKVNNATLKNGTQPLYFYSTNGILNMKNTPITTQDKYNSVEVVTQDRVSYKSQRNTTMKFNIVKQDTKIIIDKINNVDYHKTVTLNGRILGKSNEVLPHKTIRVNLNGVEKKVRTDNKGNFIYTNKTNKLGTNTITVTFDGDSNYLQSSNKSTFKVVNKPTILEYNVPTVTYLDEAFITGFLGDEDSVGLENTKVTLNINGNTYNVKTDFEGIFYYTYKANRAGTNNITVTFNGTEYYAKKSVTKTFKVNQKETMVFLDYIPAANLGDYVTISGTFEDSDYRMVKNANLALTINNERFTVRTDEYGSFTYNYKTNKAGTNTVTVTFPGNNNYITSSSSSSFKVNQTYNITLNFYKNSCDEEIVYLDRFTTLYESRPNWQWPQGVYLTVEDIYAEDLGMAAHYLITNATFYFKNSNGNIIAESFTEGDGAILSHELISGYTPLKVLGIYRKMTDNEREMWNSGYRYDLINKEWYKAYDYDNDYYGNT